MTGGWLIIADDLTGTLDTAVQFAQRQLSVLVLTDIAAFSYDDKGYEVLAIDTESRHLPPQAAAYKVSAALRLGVRVGATRVYKKIDSTLRGNIGAELAALLHSGFGGELMLAPSFPEMGRTVEKGRLFLDGIPVAATSMSRDPLDPVTTSDIPKVIARQTDIPVLQVWDPAMLRRGRGSERSIFLFDAASNADLRSIAGHLVAQDRLRLTAGSAGFAKALADTVGSPQPMKAVIGRPPVLIVSGSRHDASRRQIEHAARRGWRLLDIDPIDLTDYDCRCSSNLQWLKQEAVARLRSGRSVILAIDADRPLAAAAGGKGPQALTARLGRVVKEIVGASGISTLLIFGGDTAFGILSALRIKRLAPCGEIAPGIVVVKTVEEKHGLHLITKAGGFGKDDLIIEIESRLRG